MSAASDYTENNVINAMLRGVAFPLPSNTFVSLHTANPTDSGGNEVGTGDWPSYIRIEAEQGGAIGTGWTAPSDGESTNVNQLTYPSMDGSGSSEVIVTHWAVHDAVSGGNMLAYAPLQTSRTLKPGDIFVFDAEALTITVA